MAWHDGRTFYACPCGARDERCEIDPPLVIPCWSCRRATAEQWVPPAVERERRVADQMRKG